MRLLPSEQEAARARVPEVMGELRKEGQVTNCGSHIRHNRIADYLAEGW